MVILGPRAGALAVSLTLGALATGSWAQSYPTKPVRLLVSFSAGSGTDTIGRIIAGGLSEVLGQQVIVENRAGAAGSIGAEIAAKAPPDGYMMLLMNMGHTTNVSLYRKLPFDLARDFAPVTQLASAPAVVLVHPSLPVKSVAELVKLAKAKPGVVNYASGGSGTPTFLAAELFKAQAAINLQHVPYRSGGEALTAVITGEAPVYFGPLAASLPHVQQGRLRALAVTSAKRVPVVSQLPTVAELGYPGFESGNWYGLAVPGKTPKEIITTLHRAAVTAVNRPNVNKRLTDLGYVIVADQPDEFAAHIRSEIDKLGRIVREFRLSAD